MKKQIETESANSQLLTDVLFVSDDYSEENKKMRYCFSGSLVSTNFYKQFRMSYAKSLINQDKNMLNFVGHPYAILKLSGEYWTGYSLLLDYLHGLSVKLTKRNFEDFAVCVLNFGGPKLTL